MRIFSSVMILTTLAFEHIFGLIYLPRAMYAISCGSDSYSIVFAIIMMAIGIQWGLLGSIWRTN